MVSDILFILYLESKADVTENGEEPQSFSSRLSGFLTTTINKTKSIISEVLDDKEEESSE